VAWLVIGGVGAFVLWSRLVSLDQSLWHDEVFSVVRYTSGGPKDIVFGDYVPNNHVLLNLLSFATANVFGETEVVYRLWSVLPAIGAAIVVVRWAWRRLGLWTSATLALLVATSPIHHDLAREARGYGLAFLAGAVMLVFSYRVAAGGGRRDLAILGVAGAMGTFTVPQFIIGFVGQVIPLLVRPDLRKRVLQMLGVVGAALLVLYAPMLSDIARSPGTVSGGPLPWHGPLSAPTGHLLQPSMDVLADRDVDAYHITPNHPDRFLIGTLALIGALLLWRAGDRMLSALLVVPVLFTYSLLTAGRFHVHERYGSFLLFHALVLAAIAIVGMVRAFPARGPRYAVAGIAAATAAVALGHSLTRSRDYHEVPRENFKRVAQIVNDHRATPVVTDSTRPDGLRYYLSDRKVAALPSPWLDFLLCSPKAPPVLELPTIYIEHPFRGPNEPPPRDVSCLKRRGAAGVSVKQRDRGGKIDIWFVPASGAAAD
jgi:hypothetical protein